MSRKPVLPYPPARNDCLQCREFDADVELLDGDARRRASPIQLCHRCLGMQLASRALLESGPDLDKSVTVHLLPARDLRIRRV